MEMGGPPAAHEPRARWRAQIADSCRVLQLEWRQIWVMTLLWVLAQMPAMVYMTLAAPFGDELFQGAVATEETRPNNLLVHSRRHCPTIAQSAHDCK